VQLDALHVVHFDSEGIPDGLQVHLYLGSKGRLLDGLFEALPLPGEAWAEEGHDGYQQWLDTAKAIFKLIYKEPKTKPEG
jgi:hypothetical protein